MMIKLGLASIFSLCVAFGITTSTGCESVDRIYDCADICDTYRDCVDANYDTVACATECRENADDSGAFADKADECQACIDDRSCTGAVFGCALECVGIVP